MTARASLLAVLAVFTRTATACVELQGIVPDGGEGLLDYLVLQSENSLGQPLAPLNFFLNPLVSQCVGHMETPMAHRFLLALDTAGFSMGSMYEPNGVALDIFGDKETSDARRRCQPADGDEIGQKLFDMHLTVTQLYSVGYIGAKYLPWCTEPITELFESIGCPLSLVLDDAVESGHLTSSHSSEGSYSYSFESSSTVSASPADTPWGLAKAYIDEVWEFLDGNDGWNADGDLGGKEFNRVPFTGDFSYADSAGNEWTPYRPANTPYEFVHTKMWQPLLESNGVGYITTQEHVTPHIGVTARFFGFKTQEDEDKWGSRMVEPPPYMNRHAEIAREVIEASKEAVYDPVKAFAIPLFDSKLGSLAPLKINYLLERADLVSLQDYIKITVKSALCLYNATIMAWREKIRHDAPRPPSVVRNELGDEMVEAYAGPDEGIKLMKASEWEPYIRTMPHSEYPSASSCICEAYVNAFKHWLGTDTLDPPLPFPAHGPGFPDLAFSSWSEISEMCGESRIWAGLHFEEAVPAGVELCGGFEMTMSISDSIDALTAGDESAVVFDRDIGELMMRPL